MAQLQLQAAKGIRLSPRDVEVLRFVGEQYAAQRRRPGPAPRPPFGTPGG